MKNERSFQTLSTEHNEKTLFSNYPRRSNRLIIILILFEVRTSKNELAFLNIVVFGPE